jgi:hypothetical protein
MFILNLKQDNAYTKYETVQRLSKIETGQCLYKT